ncbi:MAG: VWA domain-containing protein [Pseudomonadota bacterium]
MIELATPLALVALLAVPLLLYLYSLRPRRRRVVLSTTRYWREALAERQRGLGLRQLLKNLSLLLLLLAMLALAFSLSAPQWLTRGAEQADVVLIIDTSASMQTRSDGGQRFDAARAVAENVLQSLSSTSRVLLLASGATPRVLTSFESDRRRLRSVLDTLQVTDEAGAPAAALSLAATLVGGRPDARIVLVTDGAFAGELPVTPNTSLELVGDGSDDNLGITHFAVRRTSAAADTFEALIRVRNFSAAERRTDVTLDVAGSEVISRTLELAPGDDALLVHAFSSIGAGEARATLDVDDRLSVDNTAYAVINVDAPLLVGLVGSRNFFLEAALAALPEIGLERFGPRELDTWRQRAERLSVSIVDGSSVPQFADDELRSGRYLLFDTVPPNLPLDASPHRARQLITETGSSALIDGLALTGTELGRARVLRPSARRDPSAVMQPLVRTAAGPVAWTVLTSDVRAVVLGFDPVRSSLPQRAAYPLLLERSLRWLAGVPEVTDIASAPAGAEVAVNVAISEGTVYVHHPDGTRAAGTARAGRVLLRNTEKTGIYGIEAGEQFHLLAVNLTNAAESDISRRTVSLRSGETSEAAQTGVATALLWPWLALLALVALTLEWLLRATGRAHA